MDDSLTPRRTSCSSRRALLDGKRALNANTHVSPHGVTAHHF